MDRFFFDLPNKEEMRKLMIENYWNAKKNKTCISYWYPKIKESSIDVRMPETTFVFSNPSDRYELFDGKPRSRHYSDVISRLEKAADEIGYPCFMKNSIYSAKHSWLDTCFIENK